MHLSPTQVVQQPACALFKINIIETPINGFPFKSSQFKCVHAVSSFRIAWFNSYTIQCSQTTDVVFVIAIVLLLVGCLTNHMTRFEDNIQSQKPRYAQTIHSRRRNKIDHKHLTIFFWSCFFLYKDCIYLLDDHRFLCCLQFSLIYLATCSSGKCP